MAATRILLAPGASGSLDQVAPHAAGLEARGFSVQRVSLTKGKAERAVAAYRAAVEAAGREPLIIGGQSFGGRVASLLAAEEPPAALVCFAYPLHAPGRHQAWEERTAHWPRIRCPVLLLSGEADPFARLELLHTAIGRLPDAELVTWPGVGHGVGPVLDEALDRVAAFIGART